MKKDLSQQFVDGGSVFDVILYDDESKLLYLEQPQDNYYEYMLFPHISIKNKQELPQKLIRLSVANGFSAESYEIKNERTNLDYSFIDETPGTTRNEGVIVVRGQITNQQKQFFTKEDAARLIEDDYFYIKRIIKDLD